MGIFPIGRGWPLVLFMGGLVLSSPVLGQDLDPLFAPPTAQDMAEVKADWSARTHQPVGVASDRTATLDGFRMDRISFDYEGLHQYGLVRYPRDFQVGHKYPVLVLLHGGFSGLWYDFTLHFDQDFPGGCLADSFFVISPTFRGEGLSGGELGNVISEGEPSIWDRDADDAMAMLTGVLDLIAEADPVRVMAEGHSRGGNLAYQLAVRDARVKRTVVLFGPSQFRVPEIQSECQTEVDGGPEAQSPLAAKVLSEIIAPWQAGTLSLNEARHRLTAWSICSFLLADDVLQVHHGLADDQVPSHQSILVAEHMAAEGADSSVFNLYTYENGQHNPATLDGYESRVESFLCQPIDSVSAAPPLVPGSVLKAWPNPFYGSVNIQANGPGTLTSDPDPMVVEIIDLKGRRQGRILVPAGGSVQWLAQGRDGRPLPAGQYFLSVRGQKDVPARRITLLP